MKTKHVTKEQLIRILKTNAMFDHNSAVILQRILSGKPLQNGNPITAVIGGKVK